MMSLKGLERAIQNLNSLSRLMVPTAAAQALNRVAGRAITQGSRKVAKEATVGDNHKKGLPVKLVRQRSRLKRAKPERLVAAIRINRGTCLQSSWVPRVCNSPGEKEKSAGAVACYVLARTFSEMRLFSSWRTGDGRLCAGWVNPVTR
jgi:hypothetical protein